MSVRFNAYFQTLKLNKILTKLFNMENITLNFINMSNDTNNSSIVIFQQNVEKDFEEISIAREVQVAPLNLAHETSKEILQLSSTAKNLKNNLQNLGTVNANYYNDGKLVSSKTGLKKGEKAAFEFHPKKLSIGVVSQVEEVNVMDSAIISQINCKEINLSGIKSADIVMTGGGPGESATAFYFSLENIQNA